jgi:hypothetical protein
MNAFRSIALLSVLVFSGAVFADVPKELPPVKITPAGKQTKTAPAPAKEQAPPPVEVKPTVPVQAKKETPAQAPSAPKATSNEVVREAVIQAKGSTLALLKQCESRGRSLAGCLEIIEGDIETRILNCGKSRIYSAGDRSAEVSEAVERLTGKLTAARWALPKLVNAKARQIGAGPRRTRAMKVQALSDLLDKAEALSTLMCSEGEL